MSAVKKHGWLLAAITASLLLSTFLMFYLYRPAGEGVDIHGRPLGQDFINEWAGTRLALRGQVGLLFNFASYHTALNQLFGHKIQPYSWSYPPHALLLFAPFAVLPYFPSLGLWTAAGLAAWLGTYRWYAGRWNVREVLLLLLSPACFMNVSDGQNGFLTAALFLCGLLMVQRRPILAGILFGVLTFKPQFGIILPFALLAMRAWKTIGAAACTFAVLAILSVAIFGVEAWTSYFKVTSPIQFNFLFNTLGLFSFMLVSPLTGLLLLGFEPPFAFAIQFLCSLLVVSATCQAMGKTTDRRKQLFLLCSAVPLISPYLLDYDLCLLTIPLAGMLVSAEVSAPRKLVYLAAWAAPTLGLCLALSPIRVSQIEAPLSMLAVFLLVLTDIRKSMQGGNGFRDVAALE